MIKVLIVEDEEKIARFIELELKHEGYEVDKALEGRTGAGKRCQMTTTLSCLMCFSPS